MDASVWITSMGVLLAAACAAGVALEAARRTSSREGRGLREANHALETELAVSRAALADTERRFDTAHDQLAEAFRALSADSLRASNEQFLQLAAATLHGERERADATLARRQQAVEALVQPIHEKLAAATAAIETTERSRRQAYGGLRQQLSAMVAGQEQLRGETAGLSKALRRPEVRGRWGEMQLRRVAELAGMAEHCDFTQQASVTRGASAGDGGSLRPDMVVALPGGREIVVDAKTPMDAYLDAAEADHPTAREDRLAAHVRQIETKVKELGGKRYQDHFASADFVVLFIPGESFLYAAVERRPGLIDDALARGVVVATPTTLVALLKTVALGWREERLAENAVEIKALGEELHRRLGTLTGHLDRLGRSVGKTVEHYNRLVGSFETQVLPHARRFEGLGIDSGRPLPAAGTLKGVEHQPRPLPTPSNRGHSHDLIQAARDAGQGVDANNQTTRPPPTNPRPEAGSGLTPGHAGALRRAD